MRSNSSCVSAPCWYSAKMSRNSVMLRCMGDAAAALVWAGWVGCSGGAGCGGAAADALAAFAAALSWRVVGGGVAGTSSPEAAPASRDNPRPMACTPAEIPYSTQPMANRASKGKMIFIKPL